ncbi:diguanylate cyclase domain-containing protein [Paraburkholderia megapolitana]|uniref:diguanylate cyclase domain-containing protein n=1 Tax=Paraburkholderia megapolitana TaxID=420953 RepID=UPI0038B6BA38
MDGLQDDALALLREKFATLSPRWRLRADSNALELSPITGPAVDSVMLSAEQADNIRALTGVTSTLSIDVTLAGHAMRLYLVGRKLDRTTWGGTGSPSTNSEAVANDLARGLSFAETVLSEVNSLVVIVNREGSIQRFNRLAEEYAGLRETDVIGKNVWELFMSAEEGSASRQNIDGFFNRGEAYAVERTVKTVKGPRLFQFRNKFVRTGSREDDIYLVCSGIDITEERDARERLAKLANTDTLTGLRNRNYLTQRLQDLTSKPESVGTLAILLIDLDNFKRINDSLGHSDGDQLLKMVAQRLHRVAGEHHEVTRIGGDEFVILVEGEGEGDAAQDRASELTDRIVEDFQMAYVLRAISYRMRASVGIAVHEQAEDTEFDLLTHADLAMYAAKAVGKGKDISAFCQYTRELSERAERGLEFYQSIQYGFIRKEFVLQFQRTVRADGVPSGVHACVCWNRPGVGAVGENELLPMAESSGFGVQLGEFQLREVCAEIRARRDAGYDTARVTVTIPSTQLIDGDLLGCVTDNLREYGLEPDALRLVIRGRLDQLAHGVLGKLAAIRAAGVKVLATVSSSSSFSNVTIVAVDGMFVGPDLIEAIPGDPVACAVVRGLAGLCEELDLDVLVAEAGRQDQIDWLATLRAVERRSGSFHEAFPE